MALRGVIAVALLTVAAVAIAAENSSSPSIPIAASTTVGAGAGVSAGAVASGGEFKPAAVFDGDANDDDRHVKPLPKVDPTPPALKPTPQHCNHVIVGGGWSGTYFAWRTTVDSGAREAKDTCLFEALDRVGGRAYSKAGIPGMQDLRIDVGAYRFDRRNHIIVSHVARDVLHAPLRCYDQRPSDQDAVCNNYGSLDNFADAYGNNRGYASGPEGLTRKFEAHGGNVWFYHRLTKVAGGGSGGSMILTFAVTDPAGKTTTATVSCDTLFLNLSPPALRNLDASSIVFTEASDDARAALEYPTEDPGAKQFLVYPATPWRAFPALREGLFANATVNPPLMGRFHDFYGKCPLNTEDGLDCWGAVLTYYDFDIKIVKEFAAKYQKSKSDPYTYIPFEDQQHQDMIKRVHNNFLDQLDIQAEKHGVKGYNRTLVPYPSGTVIAVWWSHDNDPEASLLPAPSYLNPTKFPYEVDPNHAMRNLISRPLPKRELFIANEGFSGGNGWAEPALKMTERIVYAHVDNSQPSWVHDDCHDALTGWVNQSKALGGVEDCASVTWWNMFITNDHNTQLIPREADAGSHAGELPRMYTSRSTERWELDPGSDPVYRRSCPQEFAPEYLDASWGWCDESAVEFMLQIPATGWAGFGIGTDMTHADMVIAHRDEDGEVHVGHYYSSGYRPPTPVDPPAPYMLAMNATWAPGLGFTITFKRLADCNCSNGVNVSIDGTNTPFIYAGFNNGAGPPVRQHDFMYSNAADFGCGRTVAPTFSDDIKPLFRTKDREAMLWSLDLHDYDTMSNPHTFAEVYNVIELKTVHGLAQGMPPDATWSIAELHVFKQWADQGFKSGATCPAKPPTFCGDVVQLFRPSDISEMQQYGLNLASYDDVKKYSTDILKRVRSGNMPCDEAGRWGQDKIKTFSDWIACGMIEGDGCTSLSDQDVFYMAINFAAQSPDQQQQIRAKLVEYLQQSRAQGQPGAVTNETKYRLYFDYTREAFEERLMQIYDQLEAEGAESDPATDPDFTSREKMLYRIRQLAPFNLIDGAWISNCCPTGPIDEVHSMMWGILNEEMGMGDVKHNHCDLYASLLHSVDIFLPDVRTRAFVDDPGFLPSAFTGSAYALALAAFTDDFFPELLGTTLQIEWCVLGLVPTAKLLEFWGIDPLFYNLHIAIDNADVGHGWRAKRAIEIYLDDVRAAQGEAAMQETFKRIWDGFLAFDALGTLGSDMMNHIHNMPTPRQKIMDMMGRKKKFGSRNHREKRLGSDHINDLFNDTEKFVYELENSAWVVPGNPEESPFLQHLIQFTGPMFRVFHEDDLQLWREWIMSLRPNVRQSGKLDIVDAMRHTIVRVMRTGMASEHHARIKIWGPSPTIKGEDVNQPVAVWAETVDLDPEYIMRALIDPRNELIVCGDATASPFYTHVMAPSNAMGAQFARVAADALPGLDDTHKGSLWTWREIVERWINDGCPFKAKPGETFSLFPTPHKDDWIISSRDESAFLDFYREHARRPRRDEGPRRGRAPRHHHHHHKKYKTGRHYVH